MAYGLYESLMADTNLQRAVKEAHKRSKQTGEFPDNIQKISERFNINPRSIIAELAKFDSSIFEDDHEDHFTDAIKDLKQRGYSELDSVAQEHFLDPVELDQEYKKRKGVTTTSDPEKKEYKRRDQPDISYNEKYLKRMLNKVVAELSGSEARVFSRMVKRLKKIDNAMDKLKKERDALNDETRDRIEQLFDAEDQIATRMIDTLSVTASVAKITEPGMTTNTDYKSAFNKLYELYPEMEEKLNEVLGMYTTTRQLQQKTPKLQAKIKEDISVSDAFQKLGNIVKKFFTKIKMWGKSYDRKLQDVKNSFPEEILTEEPVVSSWIDDLERNEDDGTTTMTTRGGREYDFDIDQDDHEDWLEANSHGKHYHRHLKR